MDSDKFLKEFYAPILEHIDKSIEKLKNEITQPPNEAEEKDKLLKPAEAAKMLSISVVSLWDWRKRNILKSYKIGQRVFIKQSDIYEALQNPQLQERRKK